MAFLTILKNFCRCDILNYQIYKLMLHNGLPLDRVSVSISIRESCSRLDKQIKKYDHVVITLHYLLSHCL